MGAFRRGAPPGPDAATAHATTVPALVVDGSLRTDRDHASDRRLRTRRRLAAAALLVGIGCWGTQASARGSVVAHVPPTSTVARRASIARTPPLVPGANGLDVYDTINKVYWLADADLAATDRFGLPLCPAADTRPCVNPSGSMSYTAAVAWVKAMNAHKYLGVSDWQLPTTPNSEPHTATLCPRLGPKPYRNRFGFNCTDNALGSLFYDGLSLRSPNTAVAVPHDTVGPFSNLQPYLYWGLTPHQGGHTSFSFGNGFQGANTDPNFLYLLPMVPGKLRGTPPARGHSLEVNPGGQTVYDPVTRITWLANANLAASTTFGLPRCASPVTPATCVARDGAMTWPAAEQFVKNMSAYHGTGYLGQKHWNLPAIGQGCPAYGCVGGKNPMGELFYDHLDLPAGGSAVTAPNTAVGPFNHIRPYLYWSCEANAIRSPCRTAGAAPNFEWSFSFGSGFLGTDILANDLYVTAYYVAPAARLSGRTGVAATMASSRSAGRRRPWCSRPCRSRPADSGKSSRRRGR